jgi:hypothetical protein
VTGWLLVWLGAASLGVLVAILALLSRRLRRPSVVPPTAQAHPHPQTILPPPHPPEPFPLPPSDGPAWSGPYDDAKTEPMPRRVYPSAWLPSSPARPMLPGPSSTVSTTHEQLARQVESDAKRQLGGDAKRQVEGDAKRLRESGSQAHVTPEFRLPHRREIETKK